VDVLVRLAKDSLQTDTARGEMPGIAKIKSQSCYVGANVATRLTSAWSSSIKIRRRHVRQGGLLRPASVKRDCVQRAH